MVVENVARWIWRMMGDTKLEVFSSVLVCLVIILLVRVCRDLFKEYRTLPPGPWGLPLVGSLPFIQNAPLYLTLYNFTKKYGSVFSVRLGKEIIIVLSDPRDMRECFRREDFTGKPNSEFLNILGGYGIINTEGALWKDQRKFLHEKLRRFGMTFTGVNKKLMQQRIMNEVQPFLCAMAARNGAPIDLSPVLAMSVSNVICSTIMGTRVQSCDSYFKRFMSMIDEGFKLFGEVVYVNYIPAMRHLSYMQSVRNKIAENHTEMRGFFRKIIDQHKETFDEENMRDLVDNYLVEIKHAKEEGRDNALYQGKDHNRQIEQILADLFSAGMETVKTTLEWAVIWMLHYPDAAKAVQKELEEVVGKSRLPTLDDMSSLPITEATINEVLRISSVVPLGNPHATLREVKFKDYTLPARTQVISLLHAVHMNPDFWDEPEVFRPERFITEEGKLFKPEYFMPFGVGRRICLGEVLARMEIFMFFSSLMHTYDIKLPEGAPLPSLKPNAGITMTPNFFKVCLIPRNMDLINSGADDTNGPLRNVGSH